MNTIKKIIITLVLLGTIPGWIHAAQSESITVTVRPNAYYSISIDTTNVALDLGSVDMGQSTQTVSPSTITINSTFVATDLRLQGSISSTGQPWSFDDDSSSQEEDSIAVWATFTGTNRSSAPAQGNDYFSGTIPGAAGSDAVDDQNRYVGTSAGGTNLFENNSDFDSKDMDGLPPDPHPDAKSHLWFYFRLPSATTDIDAQNISFTITATAPN